MNKNNESKPILRKTFKTLRSELSSEEKHYRTERIINHLQQRFDFKNKVVHIFQGINELGEIDLSAFQKYCLTECNLVCTSVLEYSDLSLKHVVINLDSVFIADKFGIPTPIQGKIIQPDKIDIVLVPLLSFDVLGNRLGYGKGIYDRFLSSCKKDCLFIGVCFFEPIKMIPEINTFDVPIHVGVTPGQIWLFNEKIAVKHTKS